MTTMNDLSFTFKPKKLLSFNRKEQQAKLFEDALVSLTLIGNSDVRCAIVAVNGPVGVGKSTCLNTILRALLPPNTNFEPFDSPEVREDDTITDGIDMFDGPLRLFDPEDSTRFIHVILLDVQGSGIESSRNGANEVIAHLQAETARLDIVISALSTVVLNFTRSTGVHQSDVRNWALDLHHLSNIKAKVNESGVTVPMAEPIYVVRQQSLRLPEPSLTPEVTQRQKGPLAINAGNCRQQFGTDATGYVREMMYRGNEDAADRRRIQDAYGSEECVHGLLFPISANPDRDIPVLNRSTTASEQSTYLTPAVGEEDAAVSFVQRVNHYFLQPLFSIVWAAHKRRITATGVDASTQIADLRWGSTQVDMLRNMRTLISGDWTHLVPVDDLVVAILEINLNSLADEALYGLERDLIQILEELMASGYRKKDSQAEVDEGKSEEILLREHATGLTETVDLIMKTWQEKSKECMNATTPLDEALNTTLNKSLQRGVADRVRARYQEEARVLQLTVTDQLLTSINVSLSAVSGYFSQAARQDEERNEELQEAVKLIDQHCRDFEEQVRKYEAEMKAAIKQQANQVMREAKKSRGSLLKTIAAAAVSICVSVFMPAALLDIGIPHLVATTIGGAVGSGLSSSIVGARGKQIWKAVGRGAMLSAGSYAIGSALPSSSNLLIAVHPTIQKMVAQAALGAGTAKFFGDDILSGAVQGAMSELVASIPKTHGVISATAAGMGSMCTSLILNTGGDPLEAFIQGVLVDTMNHAAHEVLATIQSSNETPMEIEEVIVANDGSGKTQTVRTTNDGKKVLIHELGGSGDFNHDVKYFWSNEDPSLIQGSFQAQAAEGVVLGVVDFVVDTAKGLVHVAMHPIDTSKVMYETVVNIDELSGKAISHYKEVASQLQDTTMSTSQRSRIITKEMLNIVSSIGGVKTLARAGAKAAVSAGAKVSGKSVATTAARSAVAVDAAIAADANAYLQWSRRQSPYVTVTEGGKTFLKLDKAALGDLHELRVTSTLEKVGYEIKDAKLPSNHGFDILGVRKVDGIVESIAIVECKATSLASVTKPKLSMTNAGKQLESPWIAEKLNKMYELGGPLREHAILVRSNLDKVRPVVAFQKNGMNSWNYQHAVPKFNPSQVESLLNW